MTDIKRYKKVSSADTGYLDQMLVRHNGNWVLYDDHVSELATLREELAATKRKFERARQERSHAEIERDTLRDENERLRILVKDSVNLLDFLFEPGSYVPAVRLFCEKVKEELK